MKPESGQEDMRSVFETRYAGLSLDEMNALVAFNKTVIETARARGDKDALVEREISLDVLEGLVKRNSPTTR